MVFFKSRLFESSPFEENGINIELHRVVHVATDKTVHIKSESTQKNHPVIQKNRQDMKELSQLTAKLSIFLRMIGMDLLNKEFKPSAYTIFYGVCILLIHVYYINFIIITWPNYQLIMRSLSSYGFAIQVRLLWI